MKRAAAVFLGFVLVCAAAACEKELKAGEIENGIQFASLTEAPPTESTPVESVDITVSSEASMAIPTIKEQPYTPTIELAHFGNFGIVSEGIAVGNLRDAPSENGSIIGRFYANTGMDILEDMGNGWYHVTSGGLDGYISQTIIETGQAAINQALKYENYWVAVTVDSLNVRMEPSLDSGILARVIYNQTYRIIADEGQWFRITIGTEEGYISKDCCRPGFTVAQAENWNQLANLQGNALTAIQWGMQYLGLPYVFGGESMETGCDCSYFVGMCMYQTGNRMPRTSLEQSETGIPVSVNEKQAGDLLFYATHGNIDHVALYIGDGKILHQAQSIGCVSISAYNYCGEPVACRRFFN